MSRVFSSYFNLITTTVTNLGFSADRLVWNYFQFKVMLEIWCNYSVNLLTLDLSAKAWFCFVALFLLPTWKETLTLVDNFGWNFVICILTSKQKTFHIPLKSECRQILNKRRRKRSHWATGPFYKAKLTGTSIAWFISFMISKSHKWQRKYNST